MMVRLTLKLLLAVICKPRTGCFCTLYVGIERQSSFVLCVRCRRISSRLLYFVDQSIDAIGDANAICFVFNIQAAKSGAHCAGVCI